ncbi:protease inhibitor I42 family protein [bacterium]|nr:protease inhibitor I42 family protein [bacterium]
MRTILACVLLLVLCLALACPGRYFKAQGAEKKPAGAALASREAAAQPGSSATDPPDPPPPPQPPDLPPEQDGVIQLGEEANGTTITIHQGQRIELSLPSNPSTGYRWDLARMHEQQPYRLDEAVLKLVSSGLRQGQEQPRPLPDPPIPPEPDEPPLPPDPDPAPDEDPDPLPPQPGEPPSPEPRPGDPPLPDQPTGSIAEQYWLLEGLGSGTAVLRLEYRRSWEEDDASVRSFNLTVLVESAEPALPPDQPEPRPTPQKS